MGNLTSDSGTYVMDEWTSAGVDEVNTLLNSYLAEGGVTGSDLLSGPGIFSLSASTSAPNFFANSGFRATLPAPDIRKDIIGWTKEECVVANCSSAALVAKLIDAAALSAVASARSNDEAAVSRTDIFLGAWFYRGTVIEPPPNGVPLPATTLLMGLG